MITMGDPPPTLPPSLRQIGGEHLHIVWKSLWQFILYEELSKIVVEMLHLHGLIFIKGESESKYNKLGE